MVSSRITVLAGMKGRKEAARGFTGLAPTMSGISLGGLEVVGMGGSS
jgi:hypothetical protein